MTARSSAVVDQILAALAEGAGYTSEIAYRAGTVACWCFEHGHPGIAENSPADAPQPCRGCTAEHVGWRQLLPSDVWPYLRKLEKRGLVNGRRSTGERQVRWSRAVPVPPASIDGIDCDGVFER